MRIPHNVNKNTKIEYEPSPQTVELVGELRRKLKTENFDWDDKIVPNFSTLCVDAICKNFEKFPIFEELNCTDRNYLLEILPTDLPLELVVPLIEDEIYWERRYKDKFGPIKYEIPPDCNWKCVFLSRFIQETIEEAQPQYNDEDNMDDLLLLLKPYIRKLKATQLQTWKPPLTADKEDIPEIYPLHHINFQPILKKLTNIEELDVIFGMNKTAEEFTWNMFKLSTNDIKNIGIGLLRLEHIKVLRLHRSRIEDDHVQVLMQQLVKNKTLVELDLSHCKIEDRGALCVAKLLTVHPCLEKLDLCNNRIGATGGEGFGFALLLETCQLRYLNLRLNPLGHDGVMGILRALVRGTQLEELVIASTQFEDETAVRFGQMLRLNVSLRAVDVSSNYFGVEGGQSIFEGMEINKLVKWMDLRETDIPKAVLVKINKFLQKNRKVDDEEQSESEEEIEEELEEILPEEEKKEEGDGETTVEVSDTGSN